MVFADQAIWRNTQSCVFAYSFMYLCLIKGVFSNVDGKGIPFF